MKRLSIISITYNNFEGLSKTIALFQSHNFQSEIELVIVDGGSKDETRDFLKNQDLTDNWVSEPDKGIYDAMNKGLKMANGAYVWFLNAGDYAFGIESIKLVLDSLAMAPDAIYGETMLVDSLGIEIGTRSEQTTRKLPEILTWTSFKQGMNVGHQAFIIKKSLALPYDTQWKHVADIDWMIRCLKNCKKVINLNSIIVNFTLDGHSTIHRKESNIERYRVLKSHYGIVSNIWNHFLIGLRHFLN
ncbi:MAG: glycosyltransferase [bacterium]|nr:glycosyltransferase [bacterium]